MPFTVASLLRITQAIANPKIALLMSSESSVLVRRELQCVAGVSRTVTVPL